jgi:hypothetical protein
MPYHPDVPKTLLDMTLDDVEWLMLTPFKEGSAARTFPADNKWPESFTRSKLGAEDDTSLVRQVNDIYYRPNKLDRKLTTPPNALIFTERSAIPVADVFRGMHEELGTPCPVIDHVGANIATSRDFWNRWDIIDVNQQTHFNREVARLAPLVDGLDHVTIIDQFVGSGATIAYGALILQHAGVKRVTGIQGRWYENALEGAVNVGDDTSRYAFPMNRIGHQVCALLEITT